MHCFYHLHLMTVLQRCQLRKSEPPADAGGLWDCGAGSAHDGYALRDGFVTRRQAQAVDADRQRPKVEPEWRIPKSE
jgi:hypothetical protein